MSAPELVDEPAVDPNAGHHRDAALDLIADLPEDELSIADDIALAAVHAQLHIAEQLERLLTAAGIEPKGGDA